MSSQRDAIRQHSFAALIGFILGFGYSILTRGLAFVRSDQSDDPGAILVAALLTGLAGAIVAPFVAAVFRTRMRGRSAPDELARRRHWDEAVSSGRLTDEPEPEQALRYYRRARHGDTWSLPVVVALWIGLVVLLVLNTMRTPPGATQIIAGALAVLTLGSGIWLLVSMLRRRKILDHLIHRLEKDGDTYV